MGSKKKKTTKRRRSSRPPCSELGSEDGIDSRHLPREEGGTARSSRKTMQLAAQAARAIQLALSGSCRDELLQSLEVVRAEPAPDATRLKVHLRPLDASVDLDVVRARLDGAHGLLRAAVAEAIRRRKAPDLLLVVSATDEES